MKLVYISPSGLFDDWARPVQIMKMCEAFSKNGLEVELVVPKRSIEKNEKNPFQYLNVDQFFKIKTLPIIDVFYGNPSPVFFWIRWFSFLISTKIYLLNKKYDYLYTREAYYPLFFKNIYLELHKFPTHITSLYIKSVKKSKGLVVLTQNLKSRLVDLGLSANKILVSHDGVRLEDFKVSKSKEEIRRELDLPQDKIIFGYVGTLKTFNMEKGVSDAINSLKFLPEKYILYVVGGDPIDVDYYKQLVSDLDLTSRVIFTGRVPQKMIPLYVKSCDIVVAPFPKNEHYEYFMSPLKIFEYMAGQVPMIVTNLASLREILKDKETAVFIEPNNPKELGESILYLSSNPELSKKISDLAYDLVSKKYTWNIRAGDIINFLKS